MRDTSRLDAFHALAYSSVDLAAAREHVREAIRHKLDISDEAIEHHPQVHWVQPDKTSISRQQMTAVLHELMLTSSGASQRYVIIERAHELTPEAANALLKTLEEPPSHVSFYLTTPSAARLLPTIRSRVAIHSVSTEVETISPEEQQIINDFIEDDIPERFVRISETHSNGDLQMFIVNLTEVLRQRHEYAILEWMQLHHLSRSAPNHRLFLEALAVSKVMA